MHLSHSKEVPVDFIHALNYQWFFFTLILNVLHLLFSGWRRAFRSWSRKEGRATGIQGNPCLVKWCGREGVFDGATVERGCRRRWAKKETQSGEMIQYLLHWETFRFWDEDDCEDEILLNTNCVVRAHEPALVGKRNSRRHSTMGFSENVLVADRGSQMLEFLSCCDRERSWLW